MRTFTRRASCLTAALLLGGVFCCSHVCAAAEDQGMIACETTPLSNAKAIIYQSGTTTPRKEPLELLPGPHVFIDDYLIASSRNVRRVVNSPLRDKSIPNPIITAKEDGCFQPYMTIIQDEAAGRFRMWYGRATEDRNSSRSRVGYVESADGIHWERPAQTLPEPVPIQFGISVIDEGLGYSDPATRFKFGWYMDGGLKIATSPDGLTWTAISPAPVLLHNHDITSIFWDPLRKRYVATVSVYQPSDRWEDKRRITMQSYSADLVHWSPPHYVLLPDSAYDQGQMQFYAMDGYLARGELIVGMVKVLRDDLKVDDPPDPPDAYGTGYTSLAWTRDGETWVRDLEPFFAPDPQKGAWDHAHAWIDDQVPVGDDVYLYYGGYARGHKVNRFEERQIGLVRIKRDRYAGQAAEGAQGTIITPPLLLKGKSLTVNASAANGMVRVQIRDASGRPIPGFTFTDSVTVSSDVLAAPIRWSESLSKLENVPIQLEFSLDNACLYSFNLE